MKTRLLYNYEDFTSNLNVLDDKFIKSDRDYCKDFDETSRIGSKKRCSKYVKPKPPDPCHREEDDKTPLPEECLDGDESCGTDLEDVSELPNVLEMYKNAVCNPTREVREFAGKIYKNMTYYSFHNMSFYDMISNMKNLRSDTFCSPAEIERRKNETKESKCMFVCEKRDPVLMRICDIPDKKPEEK